MLDEIVYKIDRWYYILGLVLLGMAYSNNFNFFTFITGAFLLAFAHAFDDRKIRGVFYLLVSLFSYFPFYTNFLICFWLFLIIYVLIVFYPFIKRTPISAFYKGYGYSLLFFLPFTSITIEAFTFYIMLGFIGTISEIFHEATHWKNDKKEGRFTTAHWLGIRISQKTREKWKILLFSFGLILFFILVVR